MRYEPHGPIKAQCLLDFVNDLQHTPTLHVDGSLNPKGVGADIVLEGPNDILIENPFTLPSKHQTTKPNTKPSSPAFPLPAKLVSRR